MLSPRRLAELLNHATLAAFVFLSLPAFAGSTGMPYETKMEKIQDSLTGPVAKFVAVCLIVLAGFGLAKSNDMGQGVGFLVRVVAGLTIVASCTTFVLPWLGFGGGAAL